MDRACKVAGEIRMVNKVAQSLNVIGGKQQGGLLTYLQSLVAGEEIMF
jgi:hypothetical protein